MQCVRCLEETASVVAVAPDGSQTWEVYFCENCHYSWRNIEPDYITDVRQRDPWGQLKGKDVESLQMLDSPGYLTIKKNPEVANG